MSYYRVIITVSEDGYVAVGSAAAPLPGEEHERGRDIIDGRNVWPDVHDMLRWLRANPGKKPGDWKDQRFLQ